MTTEPTSTKGKSKGKFPLKPSHPQAPTPDLPTPHPSRRIATLYDTTAGLVTPNGFTTAPSSHLPPHRRDLPAHGTRNILRPDEVLSLRHGAPPRAQEDDWYTQHRHLVPSELGAKRVKAGVERMLAPRLSVRREEVTREERLAREEADRNAVARIQAQIRVGQLPDSEVLEALHVFTSDFYGVMGGADDWGSLDETALLALGVLIEDLVGKELGSSGGLVFCEAAESESGGVGEESGVEEAVEDDGESEGTSENASEDSVLEARSRSEAEGASMGGEQEPEEPQRKKRRLAREHEQWGADW